MKQYIQTNRGRVDIPPDVEGIPVEQVLGDVPDSLKGAKMYEIEGEKYIAMPEHLAKDTP